MSLNVSCDSTWIHPLDFFYLYFPKGYMWDVAEETLALGTLTGLCSSRVYPGMVCCATLPLQRSRMCPGVGSGTRVLYNQSILLSWAELWLCDFSTFMCLCRFLMDGHVFFCSNWKAVISKTYLTRWRKGLGFSSTSVTWNMFSITSLFCRQFENKVTCSREGGLFVLQFYCSKTWGSWEIQNLNKILLSCKCFLHLSRL